MKTLIITGVGGLVGSACLEYLYDKYDKIVGIDNNMRSAFFGDKGSVKGNLQRLTEKYGEWVKL